MIRAEEFSFTYPVPASLQREVGEADFFRKKALDKVSFTVDKGEFILLTGGSGSGKSSLLLALCGMIPHVTGGRIGGSLSIGGKDIRRLNPSVLADTAGAAFQNPHNQIFTPSVTEEIAFPLQNRGFSPEEMKRRIKRSLDFTGLAGLEKRQPRELSGGEKQRLLLAVLLAWDPPVYLLDEPLSALDPQGAGDIMALLTRLNREQGKTIILAEKGRVRESSGYSRIFHMEEGRLSEKPSDETVSPLPEREGSTGEFHHLPSLKIDGVHFAYPGFPPLFRDFSLTLHPGEVVGLTGVNGAGKTTLASLIMGLIKPQKGSLRLGDVHLTGLTVAERSRYLGYLFQNPDHQLFSHAVDEEIRFGLGDEDDIIPSVLDYFGLVDYAHLPPALLSFAMRKRVALASVSARKRPFVILDEPDWGQDREGLERIVRFVREETNRGRGFLLISHNRALVKALSDREIELAREESRD